MANPTEGTVRVGGLPFRTSDPDQEESVIQAGGKSISPQEAVEANKAQDDLSYVDANWGTAGKAGMGVLGGLSLGLAPGIMSQMGMVDPGHIGAAQTSGAYMAGDAAGMMLPAFFSGGESLVARGLAMTPAGLMTRAGGVAERMAGSLLGDAAGLMGRAASAPLRMAAQGAVEGAIMNLGHAVGENLIQNKPFTMEALAALGDDALDGALYGGLIGGGLGTVGSIGGLAIDGMAKLGKNVAGKGAKGVGRVAKNLGYGAEDLRAMDAMEGGRVGRLREANEVLERGGSRIGDSTTGKLSGVRKTIEIDNTLRMEAAKELGEVAQQYIPSMERIKARITTDVVVPRATTMTESRATAAVESFWKDFSNIASPSKVDVPIPGGSFGKNFERTVQKEVYSQATWKGLVEARDTLAARISKAPPNPLLSDVNTLNREILNSLDSEIRQAMEAAGKEVPSLKGVSEKYWAATKSIELAKELEANLGAKEAGQMMTQGASINGNDIARVAGLGSIGHLAGGIGWASSRGIGRIVEERLEPFLAQMAYNNSIAQKAAKATVDVKSKIGESVSKFFKTATTAPARETRNRHAQDRAKKSSSKGSYDRAAFEHQASRSEQLLSANHQDRVRRAAEALHNEGYKEMAKAMMDLNQRAVLYLMNATPPRQAAKGLNSLRPIPISKVPTLEEFKFGRTYKGATNPLSVLDDLEDGSLSRDSMEAMRHIYPELHGEIVSVAMTQVAEMKARGDSMPMDKIISLGTALGAPIDRVLEGDYIGSVQSALNAPPADQPPPEQPPPPTIMAIDQTGLLTPLQSLSV